LESYVAAGAQGWFAELERQAESMEHWQDELMVSNWHEHTTEQRRLQEGGSWDDDDDVSAEPESEHGYEEEEGEDTSQAEDVGDGGDWVLPNLHHAGTGGGDMDAAAVTGPGQWKEAWKPQYTEEHWDKQGWGSNKRGLHEDGEVPWDQAAEQELWARIQDAHPDAGAASHQQPRRAMSQGEEAGRGAGMEHARAAAVDALEKHLGGHHQQAASNGVETVVQRASLHTDHGHQQQHAAGKEAEQPLHNLHHHVNPDHVAYGAHPSRKLHDDSLRYKFKLDHHTDGEQEGRKHHDDML